MSRKKTKKTDQEHGRRPLMEQGARTLTFGLGDTIANVPQYVKSTSNNLKRFFIYATLCSVNSRKNN